MTPDTAPTVAGLPFVGRDAALAELDGVLAAAGQGRGALVLIRGEAGIGKTTLAARAADRAAARGIATRFGACWLEGGAPAFWPWAQLLDAHARDLDRDELQGLAGDAAPALATISSALAARLPATEARPGAQDPATARFALLAAVAGFWLRAADRAPLLLALEDLHWADVASVLLLAQLGSELADHPLVVVGTLRGDEVAEERLRDALAELNRASPLVLELGGLSAGALAELVRHADLAPDRALVDALAARTGGNPLFVTELLRMLGAADPGGATPSRVLASEVPRHVSEVVHRRVARLPAPVAELLQAAAVIGPEGDDAVLAGTAALDLDRCLERMDVAIAAGLLAEAGPGRWRFTHALLRDALYGALATSVRRTLHDRAGRVLEQHGASPADLARHALGALPLGDRGRAVELAAQAGRAAMASLAYEEAAVHLAAALGALPHNAPPRADLLLALGEAQRSSGDTEAAREAFLAAADAAGDDAELLATAALGFADPGADLGLAFRAMGDRTPALLDRALQAVGPADTPLRVELLARLSAELYFSPEPERSRALAEEAVATARRVGDPRALVAALAVHHDGYVVGHADAATALRGSAELLQLARASGDRRTLLAARRARVFDLLVAGDLAGVGAETEAFRLLAEELRLPTYRWWTVLWRAMRALLEGRHADAEQLAFEAQALGARPFVRLADLNAMFLVFFLRREQGRLDELEPLMRPFAAQQADIRLDRGRRGLWPGRARPARRGRGHARPPRRRRLRAAPRPQLAGLVAPARARGGAGGRPRAGRAALRARAAAGGPVRDGLGGHRVPGRGRARPRLAGGGARARRGRRHALHSGGGDQRAPGRARMAGPGPGRPRGAAGRPRPRAGARARRPGPLTPRRRSAWRRCSRPPRRSSPAWATEPLAAAPRSDATARRGCSSTRARRRGSATPRAWPTSPGCWGARASRSPPPSCSPARTRAPSKSRSRRPTTCSTPVRGARSRAAGRARGRRRGRRRRARPRAGGAGAGRARRARRRPGLGRRARRTRPPPGRSSPSASARPSPPASATASAASSASTRRWRATSSARSTPGCGASTGPSSPCAGVCSVATRRIAPPR